MGKQQLVGSSAQRSYSHACKGALDMSGPGSGQFGAVFSHGQ